MVYMQATTYRSNSIKEKFGSIRIKLYSTVERHRSYQTSYNAFSPSQSACLRRNPQAYRWECEHCPVQTRQGTFFNKHCPNCGEIRDLVVVMTMWSGSQLVVDYDKVEGVIWKLRVGTPRPFSLWNSCSSFLDYMSGRSRPTIYVYVNLGKVG